MLEPGFAAIADLGEQIPHMQYIAATDARAAMGHRMNQFHEKFDLLLTPMIPITAFEVGQIAPVGTDQSNWMNWTPFTFPFNLTQQPAASIPCGFTSSGLPVALQIVAAKYRDDLVLRAATRTRCLIRSKHLTFRLKRIKAYLWQVPNALQKFSPVEYFSRANGAQKISPDYPTSRSLRLTRQVLKAKARLDQTPAANMPIKSRPW